MNPTVDTETSSAIAIIGMAGRFPGARNLDEFWNNLRGGVESISFFTNEELEAAGVEIPRGNVTYVKARGILENADMFDAEFFGMTPREAEITDPQHRVFLECAWEAMESAGYDPEKTGGTVGVFGGMSFNSYLISNLRTRRDILDSLAFHQIAVASEKDYLTTRVSYKLNLRGPSFNIQTACSTSLVAVATACRSLLDFECDMALAGAVSIVFPQKQGLVCQEGGILSPDGRCRAFDERANGTVQGEGVGIVVLKRLEDAVADGDTIRAVIKGFALNNDGSGKVGFTAPSVEGEAEVIAAAQAMGAVTPESISYVEAHGTGTALGDPIELEGLKLGFGATGNSRKFCGIGSVKSNIGHLDVAAGMAGLIKAVMALEREEIPPSLHYQKPNPKSVLEQSPFYVVDKLQPWKSNGEPRRAGVSCFGLGGTNSHVVLEESPKRHCPQSPSRTGAQITQIGKEIDGAAEQLLVLSARSEAALNAMAANLRSHLSTHRDKINLADVAYTLQVGRRLFKHRRFIVCNSVDEAMKGLEDAGADGQRDTASAGETERAITFLFPGQGAQAVDMGKELYRTEPVFRDELDRCAALLKTRANLDLLGAIFPPEASRDSAMARLTQTEMTQPALFAIEYALAKLWMSWGIRPAAMIGHSIGEYVAACLAGVFSLEDGLLLVAERGRLMQSMQAGSMLAVKLPESDVLKLLGLAAASEDSADGLSLATINAPAVCVVAGPTPAIERFQEVLDRESVWHCLLKTSHAFHSAMMEPIIAPFTQRVASARPKVPKIPFLSNLTGKWITAEEATDPKYWARHLRHTVRFSDGAAELLKDPRRAFLEVGPGQTLTNLVRQQPSFRPAVVAVSSLAIAGAPKRTERAAMLAAVGQLWRAGVEMDWNALHHAQPDKRRRIPLPTYPFERKRHFITPGSTHAPRNEGAISQVQSAECRVENGEPLTPALSRPTGEGEPNPVAGRIGPLLTGDSTEKKFKVETNGTGALAATNGHHNGNGASAPLSNVSEMVAALKRVLVELSGQDLAAVTPTTSFMEMGFDSLFLAQVTTTLQKKFGVQVAFRQLLNDFPNLERLANHLIAVKTDHGRPALIQTEAEPVIATDRELPLTEAQKEVWFACQMSDQASCSFNQTYLLRLRGKLDLPALRRAVNQLAARHEALRITISERGDSQIIHPQVLLDTPLIDLSSEAATRHERYAEILRKEAATPFDLIAGPLVRTQLIRLQPREHVLVFSTQHLICDGRSFGVIFSELGALYTANARGEKSKLEPACPFSEFVELETQTALNGATADEEYWVQQFEVEPPALELPADRPRPSTWKFQGARETCTLSGQLVRDIKQFSAQQGCTFFTTLLSSFFAFIHRLTAQTDLVVGVPCTSPKAEGKNSLVGHCVNFLPLRLDIAPSQPFSQHAIEVGETFLDAHDHRAFTFGSLIQKLNLERSNNRMPLLSVTFNLDRLQTLPSFASLEIEIDPSPDACTHFDLSFNVAEVGTELKLDCRYNTALFDAATIQRWLSHFETMLRGVFSSGAPALTLARIPLMKSEERRQLLVDWNKPSSDRFSNCTIHREFEEQVRQTPDATGVMFNGAGTTYRQLNDRVNRFADFFASRGISSGDIVAICAWRSVDLIAALIAILKSGAAYMSIERQSPDERVVNMFEDAHPKLLLTDRDFVARFEELDAKVRPPIACLDSDEIGRKLDAVLPAACNAPGGEGRGEGAGNTLAYVSFTSGSTGRPKGVCVPHDAVLRLVKDADYVSLGPDEVILQLAPISFDASTFEIWGALLNGGTLVLAPPGVPTLAELGEEIVKSKVTTLWLTAGLFNQMVDEQLPSFRNVRQLLAGGDVLSLPHVRKVLEAFPRCRLINGYGPTENTTFTCCYTVTKESLQQGSVPIGAPIPQTQVYVLDQNLEPVPIGVPGELYTGGTGLALGYLNRPDLTAERFVPVPEPIRGNFDPCNADFQSAVSQTSGLHDTLTSDAKASLRFTVAHSARLYKTGDLVRWLPNGVIEFLGRKDSQVKIRGFRVELGEIEATLLRHPQIAECAVTAHTKGNAGKQLVAYVVAASNNGTHRPSPTELRAFLAKLLPDYMVPAAFAFLDQLPLSPNGKIDRNALCLPVAGDGVQDEEFVAPRNKTESTLAEIWGDVLEMNPVSVRAKFFEMGGNSLLAIKLLARIEKIFGKRLPVAAVFQASTIEELAPLITDSFSEKKQSSLVAIQSQGARPPLCFVHGVGGGMFWGYNNLAQHLGRNQPVYAFKSRGLDGLDEFETIEEAARQYVADLREWKPHGPYQLGGYCFGGNVAFEMACQLEAIGETVSVLALMNCAPPNSDYYQVRPSPRWLGGFIKNFWWLLQSMRQWEPDARQNFFKWKWRMARKRISSLFTRAISRSENFDPEKEVDLSTYPDDQKKLWATHISALNRHQTRTFHGDVLLFRSRGHQAWCSYAEDYGWSQYVTGKVTVHIVPGAHESILKEAHAATLAAELQKYLAQEDSKIPDNAPPSAIGYRLSAMRTDRVPASRAGSASDRVLEADVRVSSISTSGREAASLTNSASERSRLRRDDALSLAADETGKRDGRLKTKNGELKH